MFRITDDLWMAPRLKINYSELRDFGFRRIIDLESGWRDVLANDRIENEIPEDYGITGIDIPCSNIFPPTKHQITKALQYATLPGKTLVHCFSTVDRSGVFRMAYRILEEGWSFDKAYEEFSKERHWHFFWWRPFLRRLFAPGQDWNYK